MALETPNEGMTTEKLYSPLFVKIVEDDYREQYSGDYWSDPLSQAEAAQYEEEIHRAILRERMPDEEPRGLMTYFHYHDSGGRVDEKVHSLHVDVEERRDRLWCVATLELREELTPEELAELKKYLSGQYSDGFGESLEQHEIAVEDGELYVSLWESGGVFFIDTEREFMQRLGVEAPAVEPPAAPDKPAPSYEERVQQLRDRLSENYEAFRREVMAGGKVSVFSSAREILAAQSVSSYFEDEHYFQESEIDFLLKFRNPLKMIVNNWPDEVGVKKIVDELFKDQEWMLWRGGYELVAEESAPVHTAEEKTSVLAWIREAPGASKEPRGDDPSRGRGGPDL